MSYPQSLRELVDVIGAHAAMKLVRWRGGRKVWVPKGRPAAHHPLSRTIGTKLAATLSEQFGGTWVNLPTLRTAERVHRDAEIHRLRRDGVAVPEIAGQLELSERRVWEILSDGDDCGSAA